MLSNEFLSLNNKLSKYITSKKQNELNFRDKDLPGKNKSALEIMLRVDIAPTRTSNLDCTGFKPRCS